MYKYMYMNMHAAHIQFIYIYREIYTPSYLPANVVVCYIMIFVNWTEDDPLLLHGRV